MDFLRTIRSPKIRSVCEHWLAMRGGRRMPGRRDLDPVAFGKSLAHVWMCDYLPDVGSFRCRLSGEEINVTFGANPRGKLIEEFIPPDALDTLRRRYLRVVQTPAVLRLVGDAMLRDGRVVWSERVILPLADDGERATHVFGCTVYEYDRVRHAGRADDTVEEEIPL